MPRCAVLWTPVQDWEIGRLCFEVDTEPYAKARDARVAALCSEAGVELRSFVSHTLYVSVPRKAQCFFAPLESIQASIQVYPAAAACVSPYRSTQRQLTAE